MKKYWIVIKNECQRQFAHRVNVLAYVVGNFLEIFVQIIIWSVIFKSTSMVKGYTYQEMITYVVIGWFFLAATSNYTIENYIARDVQLGSLSNYLVKPMSYLKYLAAFSLGRGSVAFGVAILEQIAIFIVLRDTVMLPAHWYDLITIFFMLIVGYFIKLFLSFIVGTIAFWTNDITGAYASANVAIKFFSGAYFPLSILPAMLTKISLAFPFAYVFFVPLQLYLGKMSSRQGLIGLGVEIIWLVLLYFIIKLIWKSGIKRYESAGI